MRYPERAWIHGAIIMVMAVASTDVAYAGAQSPATHIRTRWSADVRADRVLPEYPRPQLVRSAWQNLDGRWDYAITARDAATPKRWNGTILVPFPVQSQLSGVERPVSETQRLWYHRRFIAPALARGRHLLLHFGAVDWETHVFLNGKPVGEHRGGYDPFTIDITAALRAGGAQELLISVWDPTDKGPQPRGKQVLKPNGIWYTAVSGIWQTVWLEPVRAAHISEIVATPDIDSSTVSLHVTVDGAATGMRVHATVLNGNAAVVSGDGVGDRDIVLRLPAPHLWSPRDPFLYDLRVSLATGDTVRSYFGMRKIAVGRDSAGAPRLLLNNHALFEYGMLDQGWWPDGLYTAPTDAALRFDLETMKQLGFNMVRKHVKVEPARWYYHADHLGMLVWQDMPSGDNNSAEGRAEFESELHRMIDNLRNHPSIVMWVPFNEGWGQHDTERHVAWIKEHDPTRLVDNSSGWTDHHVGDVSDIHVYPGPGMPPVEHDRAAVLGEFGGLGLPIAGHTWVDRNNWGYRTFASRDTLAFAYHDLLTQLRGLVGDGLAAAIYTQTTDVEIEVNGLMTYDREVIKLSPTARADAAALFGRLPHTRPAEPTSQLAGQSWRYAMSAPDSTWFTTTFNDHGWDEGPGGFGTEDTPGAVVRTKWATPDIWLRRSFTLPSAGLVNPQWRVHHDEDADVYLNGVLVARLPGYSSGYMRVPFSAAAIAALRSGANLLAVHVHQTTGGQYIDIGIDEVIEP